MKFRFFVTPCNNVNANTVIIFSGFPTAAVLLEFVCWIIICKYILFCAWCMVYIKQHYCDL